MDSTGYISKEIDDCGHYISLNNGIKLEDIYVD